MGILNDEEQHELYQHLAELKIEHRDLDAAIDVMAQAHYVDQIQMTRLKKRKLSLKDSIARIQSRLIPDLNA